MSNFNYLKTDVSEFCFSNSKGHRVLTWEYYHKALKELIDCLKESEKCFDVVYGLPKGGLIPATTLSYNLEIPLELRLSELDHVIYNNKLILLVDDILDTGNQMETTRRLLSLSGNLKIKILSIVYNENKSSVVPDYYCFTNKHNFWIEFPWENNL